MNNDNYGKVHVYTGNGKGKTTAATGLAVRAAGHGKKIAIVYFDKGGSDYGERKTFDRLGNITYYPTGLDRIDKTTRKFRFGITPEDLKEASRALKIVEELYRDNDLDLLVLDEINSAIGLKLVDLDVFLKLLDNKPQRLELILTGRHAHDKILERADLVTEMKMIKHYFNKGLAARKGIEY